MDGLSTPDARSSDIERNRQYYSPGAKGFYHTNIHGQIPADAVELTKEQYEQLLTAQSAGKQIVADTKGRPIAQDPPTASLADLRVRSAGQLETALHKYVFKDYSPATQITLQVIFSDPSSTATQRAASKEVFDWIIKTVLPYYYTVKSRITTSIDPEAVTWDFEAHCGVSSPRNTLHQILQMVSPEGT